MSADGGLGAWAWLAIALLLTQVALGALLSGSYAALARQGVVDCVQTAAAAGWDWRALNPWQPPMLDPTPPFNAAGALTHVAHRIGAGLLLAVFAALADAAWRHGRGREALALLLLLALQALLGWAAVASGLPIALVLAAQLERRADAGAAGAFGLSAGQNAGFDVRRRPEKPST